MTFTRFLLFSVSIVSLVGCGSTVTVRSAPPSVLLHEQFDTRLVSTSLSALTTGAARSLGVKLKSRDDRLMAIDTFIAEAEREPSGVWRMASAELLLDQSLRTHPQDVSLDLACARQADLQLSYALSGQGGLLGSDTEFAADLYHRAVSRIITGLSDSLVDGSDPLTVSGQRGEFLIHRTFSGNGDRTRLRPAYFDRLLPTDSMRISGMASRHRIEAFGCPVVAVRDQQDAKPPRNDHFVPPEGEFTPATATLDFESDARVSFELWNPDHISVLDRHGGVLRLSSDTTAPIAALFAKTRLAEEAKSGMFSVEKHVDRIGIYLHEPYDPEKIPLLMVHGLRSSPITWRDMLNGIRSDPELRSRYQVWMFLYPTGLPVFRSAAYLRAEMKAVLDRFDPEREDPGPRRTVLVSHSMGGLLAKMQVQSSGDELWNSLSPQVFDQIDAPIEVREHLREVFFFEPNEDIERVVFIATPHGGSDIADSFLGRLGDALVDLPGEFEAVEDWLRNNQDGVDREDAYQITRGVPTSIDDLQPDSPHLLAIRKLPLRNGVSAHTIYGIGERDGNSRSDGVVPEASARIPGVASELAVDSGHSAHTHPLAIREVRRILRVHAGLPEHSDSSFRAQ